LHIAEPMPPLPPITMAEPSGKSFLLDMRSIIYFTIFTIMNYNSIYFAFVMLKNIVIVHF